MDNGGYCMYVVELSRSSVFGVPQQNNMNSHPQPTYNHQHLFTKNHKLYQQLIQDDFPTYNPASPPTHAATIKFAKPAPSILPAQEAYYSIEREEFSPRLPRSGNLFKGFQTGLGRMSNQATQSLSSNYCITEHENEENSTVNLYSLSRNHIEPDLDFSRSPTAHIDPDQSLTHHTSPMTPEAPILEGSILNNRSHMNNQPVLEQEQSSQLSENIKKYRSLEYSQLAFQHQEEETEGKVPKVLAQKYLRNDITKKFSQGHDSEAQSTFKTVLNEIHVVSYRIGNQLKPYAYSLPIDHKQYTTQQNITLPSHPERRGKANSLNLRNREHSVQQQEMIITPAKNLYFSNHTQITPLRPNVAHSEAKKTRQAPRSQPKYTHSGNERNNRSNSIQCKIKPNISNQRNPQQVRQHFEHSQVTKLFKNNTFAQEQQEMFPQQASVIYESTGVNLCCSLRDQPTKINFMPRPKEQSKQQPRKEAKNEQVSPFFLSSIDMSNVATLQNPRGSSKINPIQMIRQMSEGQGQRGIKLVGFPQRKDKA